MGPWAGVGGLRLAARGSKGGQENGAAAGSGEPSAVAFLREAVGTVEDAGGRRDGDQPYSCKQIEETSKNKIKAI
uniref:Uncharacterized protein n=2 Tax=Oryza sativa subsp. japonica TaxID=39947 RepID=Q84SX3_ORYSJ|nr:hypothetical protein [Oryza sativa Japonica Group]ABF98193.1 hypothetical protein LOC_Os03g47564 [Oryza sativa Japonica Group]